MRLTELDLSSIEGNEIMRDGVWDALARDELPQFLGEANGLDAMTIVINNAKALQGAGVLEECLYRVYVGPTGWDRFPGLDIRNALLKCNREKLRAQGADLPKGDCLAYRGINGAESQEKAQGLSWHSSLPRACREALGNNAKSPRVYQANIKPAEIYFMCKRIGGGSEYVADAAAFELVTMSAAQLEQYARQAR